MTTMLAADNAPPYLADFGLAEAPFTLTPDERFLHYTTGTMEALAHGRHVIQQRRGLVTVQGVIGSGKTTLAQKFVRDETTAGNGVAYLHRVPGGARQSESMILRAIEEDLDLPPSRTGFQALRKIMAHAADLGRLGKTLVVIVDDAHKSRSAAIAAYLALLNLQATEAQLVQVLLFGEAPELANVLTGHDAAHSRLAFHTSLNPLTPEDTAGMLAHRLRVAGRSPEVVDALFRPDAVTALHNASRGIPRIICTVANVACLFAWDDSRTHVEATDVDRAADRLMHA